MDLRATVGPDGQLSRYVYDYSRHLVHSEETDKLIQGTKMKLDPNANGKENDVFNIEYVVKGEGNDGDNTFNMNVLRDLRLRYQPTDIPSCKVQRVVLLRQHLHTKYQLRLYRDSFEIYEKALCDRLMCPGLCIPCVLHHNNRVTEKVLQQILLRGMNHNLHRLDEFLATTAVIVNRDVFGKVNITDVNSCGWKVPITDKKQLDDVKLSNSQARRFIDNFEVIVNHCLANHVEQDQWLIVVERLRIVAKWLDSKEHFAHDDVRAFQLDADLFCDVYIDLTGRDGMTNYLHSLYAGHYAYFLKRYGNLYRYSQQGWENLNSQCKRSFHMNSAKGGGKNGSSKLRPVFFRLQRSMFWRFGHLDSLFASMGHDMSLGFEYGKVKRTPLYTNQTAKDVDAYCKTLFDFASSEINHLLDIIDEEDEFDTIDDDLFLND